MCDIVYDILYDVVYDQVYAIVIVYDIVYDIACDIVYDIDMLMLLIGFCALLTGCGQARTWQAGY